MARITPLQAAQIRAAYQPGRVGYKRLARTYGVHWTFVRRLIRGLVPDQRDAERAALDRLDRELRG